MQMQMAQLTTGGTLRDLMSEEDRAEYEAAMGELGIPAAALDGFEPWMAFMTLSQACCRGRGKDRDLCNAYLDEVSFRCKPC